MIKNTFLLLSAMILLTGCTSTYEGLKSDLGKFGDSVSQSTSSLTAKSKEMAMSIQQGGSCPSVSVPEKMDRLTEFNDPEKTESELVVSSLQLSKTESICTKESGVVAMQIDMTFDGELGPKGKRKNGDKPFFSYPYFIIVKDLEGKELAREIFAANVTYADGQEQLQVVETIRQRLPLVDGKAPYMVEVGFSLTEEQLFYNAQPNAEG